MAINIRCSRCKSDMKLTAKKCQKCGTPIPKKGRLYKVVIRQNGKRKTKIVTNLELANEIETKLKTEKTRDEYDLSDPPAAPHLDEVWQKFLPWAEEHKKSWRTDDYYYRKHLAPIFGDKTLNQISPFDLEKLMLKMKKRKNQHGKPYSDATIKHQIVLLSRLYSVAEMWGLYSGPNPCKKVKKPTLNNQKTEHLSNEELSRLNDTLATWPDKMSVTFIRFAMFTGFRRGELFKLKWQNVDLERKTATLVDPKGNKDQIIPLSNEAVNVLHEIPREYDTPYIFYGKNGQQRTNFKGPWDRIKKAAELPDDFRLHGLRHNFASTLVSNGVPLYTVQKLLCHKDAKTTSRYAHLADQTLRDAVAISDELFRPKKKITLI
jgi:integrase